MTNDELIALVEMEERGCISSTSGLNRLEQERRERGEVGSESEGATDDDGSEE